MSNKGNSSRNEKRSFLSSDPASDYEVSTLIDAKGEPIPFRRPEGLAIDSDGNLYIVESLGGVWRVSPEGVVENLVTCESLSLPAKMVLGDDGTLIITESAAHRVLKIETDGNLVGAALTLYPTPHQFHLKGYFQFLSVIEQ